LTTKASTYLQCWRDVVEAEVADMGACEEAMADCAAKLAELEVTSEEENGEEEGDEVVEEEPEPEEDGEECEEGDEGCEQKSESSAEEMSDDGGEVFIKEEVALLTPV